MRVICLGPITSPGALLLARAFKDFAHVDVWEGSYILVLGLPESPDW